MNTINHRGQQGSFLPGEKEESWKMRRREGLGLKDELTRGYRKAMKAFGDLPKERKERYFDKTIDFILSTPTKELEKEMRSYGVRFIANSKKENRGCS